VFIVLKFIILEKPSNMNSKFSIINNKIVLKEKQNDKVLAVSKINNTKVRIEENKGENLSFYKKSKT
jgi:hypothetical protein